MNNFRRQLNPAKETAKTEPRCEARVLLVEDDLINQKVAQAMLKICGCCVDLADNGLEALEALTDTRYDLIFMDCHMPEMNGYETTRAIKAQAASKTEDAFSAPVVALTANSMESDRDECLAAGMDDFLSKPFKQEALRTVLQRWLPRAGLAETGSANSTKVINLMPKAGKDGMRSKGLDSHRPGPARRSAEICMSIPADQEISNHPDDIK